MGQGMHKDSSMGEIWKKDDHVRRVVSVSMVMTMAMMSTNVKTVREIRSANAWMKKRTGDGAETAMKRKRLAELARMT